MSEYKYPILAKPSGITLKQHKQNVMSEADLILDLIPHAIFKYDQKVKKDLRCLLKVVCEHHDDGKNNVKWQSACQKDFDNFLVWRERNNNATYKEYASQKDSKAGINIRNCGIRHEFHFLELEEELPLSLQVAIAAHHQKLSFFYEKRWGEQGASYIWKRILNKSNNMGYSFKEVANLQYEYSALRGLLQLADHRASAKEEGNFVPDLAQFSYKFPYSSRMYVQSLVEDNWENDLLLLRAPTGAGKTDASLIWGSLQIQNKKADRLIIAMPTRFTSNALAVNIAENLSETGLYHSSAWFSKFQEKVDIGEIDKQEAEKTQEFARLLQTPITVCTIDHLLMALTLSREDHHLITFNLANACLVIDEADFYDDFTQANIFVLLELLKYWDVPVLLMSASLPEYILPICKGLGYKVNQILEDKSDVRKNGFAIKEIRDYSTLNDIEDLLELMLKKGTGIIYANTVDKAYMLYEWFENRCDLTQQDIILYHSRFTEPHKKEKEEELISALGKDAWVSNCAKGIAILTQIGEMSINISADIMISESCPIDRLIQRAGRVCRFNSTKVGEIYIINPQEKGVLYPAPYGVYDNSKKQWIPYEAFLKTLELIECKTYKTETLIELLKMVYSERNKVSVKSSQNAKHLKESFMNNWLINPRQLSSKEDADVAFWRSRSSVPSGTVYTVKPQPAYFNSYYDFQIWKIRYSIDLPIYLIERGVKQSKIDTLSVRIHEDEIAIYIIKEGYYNKRIGAVFINDPEHFDR